MAVCNIQARNEIKRYQTNRGINTTVFLLQYYGLSLNFGLFTYVLKKICNLFTMSELQSENDRSKISKVIISTTKCPGFLETELEISILLHIGVILKI